MFIVERPTLKLTETFYIAPMALARTTEVQIEKYARTWSTILYPALA
jgi:hypothetical protein